MVRCTRSAERRSQSRTSFSKSPGEMSTGIRGFQGESGFASILGLHFALDTKITVRGPPTRSGNAQLLSKQTQVARARGRSRDYSHCAVRSLQVKRVLEVPRRGDVAEGFS